MNMIKFYIPLEIKKNVTDAIVESHQTSQHERRDEFLGLSIFGHQS